MNLLIINTCNAPMYVIASNDVKRAIRFSDSTQRKYNSELLKYIDECLNELSIEAREIDVVACVVGAGSFTGIRLGISAAQAFARGTGAKLISLNEFEIMSFGQSGRIMAAIDAGHGNYYYGEYNNGLEMALGNITYDKLNAFDGKVIVYDGNVNYDNVVGLVQNKIGSYTDTLIPLYLKASQAEREEAARILKAETEIGSEK